MRAGPPQCSPCHCLNDPRARYNPVSTEEDYDEYEHSQNKSPGPNVPGYCRQNLEPCCLIDDQTWNTLTSLREKACRFINSETEDFSTTSESFGPPQNPNQNVHSNQGQIVNQDQSQSPFMIRAEHLANYEPESSFLKRIKRQYFQPTQQAYNLQTQQVPPQLQNAPGTYENLGCFPFVCEKCISKSKQIIKLGEKLGKFISPSSNECKSCNCRQNVQAFSPGGQENANFYVGQQNGKFYCPGPLQNANAYLPGGLQNRNIHGDQQNTNEYNKGEIPQNRNRKSHRVGASREREYYGDKRNVEPFELIGDQPRKSSRERRRKKEKASEHKSRSKKRVKRRFKKKPLSSERLETFFSEDLFEPSLKKPHENSCERCWKFASPSRSPVNKPDQRYNPNFRRAHSCTEIITYKRGNIKRHVECKHLEALGEAELLDHLEPQKHDARPAKMQRPHTAQLPLSGDSPRSSRSSRSPQSSRSTRSPHSPQVSTSRQKDPPESTEVKELLYNYMNEEPDDTPRPVGNSFQRLEFVNNKSQRQEPGSNKSQKPFLRSNKSQTPEPRSSKTQRLEPSSSSPHGQEPAINVSHRQEPAINVSHRQEPAINVSHRQEPANNVSHRQEPAINVSHRQEPVGNISQRQETGSNISQRQELPNNVSHRQELSNNLSHRQEPVKNISQRPATAEEMSPKTLGNVSQRASKGSRGNVSRKSRTPVQPNQIPANQMHRSVLENDCQSPPRLIVRPPPTDGSSQGQVRMPRHSTPVLQSDLNQGSNRMSYVSPDMHCYFPMGPESSSQHFQTLPSFNEPSQHQRLEMPNEMFQPSVSNQLSQGQGGSFPRHNYVTPPQRPNVNTLYQGPMVVNHQEPISVNRQAQMPNYQKPTATTCQPPMPTGHHSPMPANYQSPMLANHQSPMPANHQSPMPANHQSPMLGSYQSPMQGSHLSPMLAGHQVSMPGSHQSPMLAGHQVSMPGSHQSPMLAGHQVSIPGSHQSPMPGAHQIPMPVCHQSPMPAGHHVSMPVCHQTSMPTDQVPMSASYPGPMPASHQAPILASQQAPMVGNRSAQYSPCRYPRMIVPVPTEESPPPIDYDGYTSGMFCVFGDNSDVPVFANESDIPVFGDISELRNSEPEPPLTIPPNNFEQGGLAPRRTTRGARTRSQTPNKKDPSRNRPKSPKTTSRRSATADNVNLNRERSLRTSRSPARPSMTVAGLSRSEPRKSKSPKPKISSNSPTPRVPPPGQTPVTRRTDPMVFGQNKVVICPQSKSPFSGKPHPVKKCLCVARVVKSRGPEGVRKTLCCHCEQRQSPRETSFRSNIDPSSFFTQPDTTVNGESSDQSDGSYNPNYSVFKVGGGGMFPPETSTASPQCYVPCNVMRQPQQENLRNVSPQNQNYRPNVRKTIRGNSAPPLCPPSNDIYSPRRYTVFYMTQASDGDGEDVEVLVEELTQKESNNKDSKTKNLSEKMKKIMECPSESMALRFQKGVNKSSENTPNTRVLYF